jgi:hypothetical protein
LRLPVLDGGGGGAAGGAGGGAPYAGGAIGMAAIRAGGLPASGIGVIRLNVWYWREVRCFGGRLLPSRFLWRFTSRSKLRIYIVYT